MHRVINLDGTNIENKKREPGILSLTDNGQRLSTEFSETRIKSKKEKVNEDHKKTRQNRILPSELQQKRQKTSVIEWVGNSV